TKVGERISTKHATTRQKAVLLLLLRFRGVAASASASTSAPTAPAAAHSALRGAHMDEEKAAVQDAH
ncbi:hypothetical protein CRENBAI_004966, partial [Crenichthys baileyi]